MSLLFKNLRVHQVFGANTDVGKTVLTTALVRASAQKSNVFYLKPVSTGALEDADDKHVLRYVTPNAPWKLSTECLFRYDHPVSPHLALKMAGSESNAPSDTTLANAIASYIRRNASDSPAHMYVETAGGVHSPTISGTSQADAYRPLFLPTVLIGDSKLGGISTTLAAYEALLLRGYIIDAVLLFQNSYYQNSDYLKEYFAEKGIYVGAIEPPPPVLSDPTEHINATKQYYERLVPRSSNSTSEVSDEEGDNHVIRDTINHLSECHARRLAELDSMPRRTIDAIWWPFVQHSHVKHEDDVAVIDSASTDFFSVYKKASQAPTQSKSRSIKQNTPTQETSLLSAQFDSSASWWTQTFGHAYTPLTHAAARAAGRYGHVMFPRATHLPALNLAERLVKDGPGKGWASRAFISDNGSTGMEVALKMALRAFSARTGLTTKTAVTREVLGVLGLKGSYHGDTIGAMDACEEAGVYTCEWHDAKGFWLESPRVGVKSGEVVVSIPVSFQESIGEVKVGSGTASLQWLYNVEGRLESDLAGVYRRYILRTLEGLEKRRRSGSGEKVPRLAALVLEPLVMGAGGMIFVDPLFQRVLVDVVRTGDARLGLMPPFRREITLAAHGAADASAPREWKGLPVVFDEVFAGLYRLGIGSTAEVLGVSPDVSVHAKTLTGGLVPLAVTLASESVFEAFLGEGKESALLHGHSYSAHAVGCEVAVETLKLLQKLSGSEEWNMAKRAWQGSCDGGDAWSFWDPGFVENVSRMARVQEVMTLGCVLAIRLKDDSRGYLSHSAEETFAPLKSMIDSDIVSAAAGGGYSVHYRTLGNVGYFMTSLNTASAVIRSVENRIWHLLVE